MIDLKERIGDVWLYSLKVLPINNDFSAKTHEQI